MKRKSGASPILIVLLLSSLSVNVWILLRDRPVGVDSSERMDARTSIPYARPESKRAIPDAYPHSRARSERVGFDLSAPFDRMPAPHPVPETGEGGFEALPEVNASLQASMLDLIAREHLRRHWLAEKANIDRTLLRDLNDREKLEADLLRDVNEIATLLNLDDADRADFEERYAELRTRRIERVRKSMRADFVDYAVLYEQIKAYFAEEDELVGQLHGPEAVKKLRLARLESRTALLAIAATLAGQDWEGRIEW